MTITEEKKALRADVRARERALSDDYRAHSAAEICAALEALDAFAAADTVLAFSGTAREIDTRAFLRETLARGKTLLLPRCEPERQMALCVVRDLDADLTPGVFGILEPKRSCPQRMPEEVDFAVIPCTSFDREGNRLGQGGGYYDRVLPRLRCATACICREALLSQRVPVEPHDMRCSLYLTECGVLSAASER